MRKKPIFLACVLMAVMLLAAHSGFAAEPEMTEPPMEVEMTEDGEGIGLDEGVEAASEEGVPAVTPTPTPTPTEPPVVNDSFTIEAELGYEGLLILNKWSPLFVTVTNHGADFDGTLGVNVFITQTEYDRYEMPLTLAQGASKRVMLPVQPQTRQDMYAFELMRGSQIIAEQRVPTSRHAAPETMAIGLLSEEPQALTYLNHRANGLDTLRGEVWLTIPLTADTFPATADLMNAFAILVVDDIDPRTLSQEQQEALTAWLLKGGFVFVSGGAQAATSYPFFTEWTGLTAGGLAEGEDITPQLLSYVTMKGTPVQEPVWRNDLPAGGALIATEDGEHGLLMRHRAGAGSIYTAAFDMGGKPMAGWTNMGSFWPRMLRQSASVDYANLLSRVESSRYGDNEAYNAQNLISTLRVDNQDSGIPVLVILAVYLFVVGVGGYLLLKRLDRREWLWVATPVAAIVFALLLLLLSRGSTMNEPVTLTASRVSIEGGTAQANTYIGVATSEGGELTIETDKSQLPNVLRTDSYWYDEQTQDRLFRPVDMRQRYRFDTFPKVGFVASEAWDAKMLMLTGIREEIGDLSVRMWMEADGMHGEAVNDTEYLLKDCIVVTAMGYSKIGDMLPGQTASFEMLYAKKAIDPNDMEFKVQPNTMYSTLDLDPSATQHSYYYNNGVYSYLDAAIFEGREYNAYPLGQQRVTLAQLFSSEWQFYENTASFYFFGFNDSIGKIQVTLNGKPVTRTAHTAVVGAKAAFEPIGPTGVVMFPQGTIPAELVVDQGPDAKARVANEDDVNTNDNNGYNSSYLSLGAPAALRFMLPEWGSYEIEMMTLLGMTYDAMPTLYLYNNETEQWDEQLLLTVSMDGEGWAPYIDAEGGLYARYVTVDESSRYGGMSMPSISLRGEVK